jgi:hypothetical protein
MTITELEQLKAQGKQRTAVALAACSLAGRRHENKDRQGQHKIYTGYLLEGCRRAYRGQPVILPDSTLGFIYGIQRGKAAIWKESPFVIGEREHMVLDVSEIRRYRLPSAVELGRLKSGKRERPSERKQESCRRNGRRPCALGKRRGRPRKPVQSKNTKARQTVWPTGPMPGTPHSTSFEAAVAFFSQARPG